MKVRSHEGRLLSRAEATVRAHVAHHAPYLVQEARFQLLEGVASRLSGFDLADYQRRFDVVAIEPLGTTMDAARRVIQAIDQSGIPDALAVSALAREALEHPDKRSSGAYHTDFRLARHLAHCLTPNLPTCGRVLDPACGAGMLLTALMLESCGGDRRLAAEWLSEGVSAADLSANALRGSLLSLACLTDDLDALQNMHARWHSGDSLMLPMQAWSRMATEGFDAVIANPPWEKLKLTRHEYLRANGHHRHYGADYVALDTDEYSSRARAAKSYARTVAGLHQNAATGELDVFVAFSDLARKLLRPGGEAALLVPAGLIRSKGTEQLRQQLSHDAEYMSFQVFENRARFFEIDTRFKFLCAHWRARRTGEKTSPIVLRHGLGTNTGVELSAPVHIGRAMLARLRPDLSVPEVRSDAAWHLFCRMIESGTDWSRRDSSWHPEFMREVDMTRDRSCFRERCDGCALPLIEGRMVHQHRFGAKSYVDGTGRRAVWKANPPGASEVCPQFFIAPDSLSERARRRVKHMRAGFCDITGQTNERSLLATMVPPGVVCGNKVPTIIFPNDPGEDRLWLWLAVANSLPFDWLIRRVITTTVNYFHLLSLRLPAIEPTSLPGRKLVVIARQLANLDAAGYSPSAVWKMAHLRAKADQIVATAYGLSSSDLHLILQDFPLLDRSERALKGEARSTVTRDVLKLHSRQLDNGDSTESRVRAAEEIGAMPYLPAQFRPASNDHATRLTLAS